MRAQKRRIDRVSIEATNSMHKQHIAGVRERLKAYDEAKLSKKADTCNYCAVFNRPRISGQAFTNIECGICGKEMGFSNTDVDVICSECAVENHLCKHCGGDLEMKNKRNRPMFDKGGFGG